MSKVLATKWGRHLMLFIVMLNCKNAFVKSIFLWQGMQLDCTEIFTEFYKL